MISRPARDRHNHHRDLGHVVSRGADFAVIGKLRVVRVGWAFGDFGSPCHVEEHLILPEGFKISAAATKKHHITNESVVAGGIPLSKALTNMLNDARRLVHQGGRLCSHHLEFDAGIIAEEMNRCGLSAAVGVWEELVMRHGFCTMGRDVGKWIRQQSGEADASRAIMKLNELVCKLLPDAPALLAKHHSAGNDAYMHWRVLRELVQRCGEDDGTTA